MLRHYFLDHPRSIGESYVEHLGAAAAVSLRLMIAAFACFIHAVVPGVFVATASKTINHLHDDLARRTAKRSTGSQKSALLATQE